jgi:hypothetical protein
LDTGYRRRFNVAAELGIADLLKDSPRTIDNLAQATGAHPPSLYRLLRLLASEGVFIEQEQGQFALTPVLRQNLVRVAWRTLAIACPPTRRQEYGRIERARLSPGWGGFVVVKPCRPQRT